MTTGPEARKLRQVATRGAARPSPTGGAGAVAAAPKRHQWRLRIALATTSLFLSLLLVEFAVRWHVEGGPVAALRSFAGGRVDAAGAPGALFVPDDQLGYRFNRQHAGVNAHGMHDRAVEREHASCRALVLGDSVSWEDGGWVDRMRPRLHDTAGRPIDLVNASVPGYTAWQERAFYLRDLESLSPDVVVWQYCLNDNHRELHRLDAHGNRLLTPEAKLALLPPGDGWWERFSRWSYTLIEVRRLLWARNAGAKSRFPWDAREDLCTAWQAGSWPQWEESLQALHDALTRRGARLAVVAFPIQEQLDAGLLAADRDYVLLPQRELARRTAALGVPLLDLQPAFLDAARAGQALFTDGIHLTDAGHATATAAVAAFLQREGLLTAASPRTK